MNWGAISAIAEVVGVIAVVVSLVYVGLQVKQNTQQLRHDNLLASIRGTLDSNWLYHRNAETFEVFRQGIRSFDSLSPQGQAMFHSIIVDIAFYLETVRSMVTAGLIDPNALAVNNKFIVATLITPGGREWWAFAKNSPPMPQPAMDYIESLLESEGDSTPPITELQPWFAT
ncbi:MAG: hypothetical protein P8X81_14000 [Woeseiaceae bacterium]|jgi:hypothetical protein